MVDNKGPFVCTVLPAGEAIMRSEPTTFEISDPTAPYYDICNCLVPTYLPIMPVDPQRGGWESCDNYNTEYTIQEVASLVLKAPHAQPVNGFTEISVTLPGEITVIPPEGGDTTPPTVGTTSPTSATVNVATTFSASVSDNVEVTSCSLFVDGIDQGLMTLSALPCTSCNASKDYTFTLTGIFPMYARCSDGAGNTTNGTSVDVTVTTPPVPPTAPSNLTGNAFCAGSNDPDISLSWTDNSNNEDGFKLYRGNIANFTPTDPPLATLTANTTFYTDTAPSPSTTYYYKIKAFNAGGDSTFASSPAITTDSCAPTFVLIPSSANILVGQTQQFDGEYDPDGPGGGAAAFIVPRVDVTWSSSDPSIATINSTGLATGAAAGSVTISGVYSGITATANLTVTSPTTQLWGSATCETGALNSQPLLTMSMGYRFTPNNNITVTQLCGRWPAAVGGTRTIRLQDSTYNTLRNASVTSSGSWACAPITSIILNAGSSYYVSEYGTGYYYQGLVTLPRPCNNVAITDSCYEGLASGGFTAARTCSSGIGQYMYGQADIFFSP